MTEPVRAPAQGPVVILFSGPKCAPCEALKPLLAAELARRPGVQYMVLTPGEATMPLFRAYGVRSSPTVVFLRNGTEIGRFTGFRNAETLAESLNRWHAI